jgi:hypothetical protein
MASLLAIPVTDARFSNVKVRFIRDAAAPLIHVEMSPHPQLVINRAHKLTRKQIAALIESATMMLTTADEYHYQQEHALMRFPLFSLAS